VHRAFQGLTGSRSVGIGVSGQESAGPEWCVGDPVHALKNSHTFPFSLFSHNKITCLLAFASGLAWTASTDFYVAGASVRTRVVAAKLWWARLRCAKTGCTGRWSGGNGKRALSLIPLCAQESIYCWGRVGQARLRFYPWGLGGLAVP